LKTSSSSSNDVYYIASGFGHGFINGDFYWGGTYYDGQKLFFKWNGAVGLWPLAGLKYMGGVWKIIYQPQVSDPVAYLYQNDNSLPEGGTWSVTGGTAPAGTITKIGV
jgi:hypothetical protein